GSSAWRRPRPGTRRCARRRKRSRRSNALNPTLLRSVANRDLVSDASQKRRAFYWPLPGLVGPRNQPPCEAASLEPGPGVLTGPTAGWAEPSLPACSARCSISFPTFWKNADESSATLSVSRVVLTSRFPSDPFETLSLYHPQYHPIAPNPTTRSPIRASKF